MDRSQIRFTEEQAFPAWAYAALAAGGIGAVFGLQGSGKGLPAGLVLALALGLAADLLFLKTVVTGEEVVVTFGYLFPLYRRRIPLSEIAAAEAVTYSPLAEYGGWGIRGWGGNVALNARGDRGVRLTLRDGGRVLIGSQRPEALAAALRAGEGTGSV